MGRNYLIPAVLIGSLSFVGPALSQQQVAVYCPEGPFIFNINVAGERGAWRVEGNIINNTSV